MKSNYHLSKAEIAQRQQISRRKILEELQLLASVDEQLKFQRDVPHVNITGEIICAWFDESYCPEDEIFRAGFLAEELKAMRKSTIGRTSDWRRSIGRRF